MLWQYLEEGWLRWKSVSLHSSSMCSGCTSCFGDEYTHS